MIKKLPKYKLVKRPDRNNLFYVRFSYRSKQFLLNTNLGNEKEARSKAIELIEAHIERVESEFRATSNEKLPVVVEEFLTVRYPNKLKTRSKNRSRISVLLNALGTSETKRITEPLVRKTYLHLVATKVFQEHYLFDLIVAWKCCFKWLIKQGYLAKEDYFANIVAPKASGFRKVTDIIPDEEFEQLLPQFSPQDQEYLTVMRYTSIYPSDIYELRKKHLIPDLDPNSKTGWKMIKKREKAKSRLEVYKQPLHTKIAPILVARVERCKNPEDKLFPEIEEPSFSHFGNNLNARWQVRHKKVFKEKQSKKLTILRHTFITKMVESRVPSSTLKQWIGHAPHSTVLDAIYNHHENTAVDMQ